MDLSAVKIALSLTGKASFTGVNAAGSIGLGGRNTDYLYPAANRMACASVKAAANGNVATLTLSTGVIAQTTGSPIIVDGDGKDVTGDSLATITHLQGLRLKAKAANTSTIAITKSGSLIPGIDLAPGVDLIIAFPAAGLPVSAATLIATFAAINDELEIDFIAKTA